MSTDKRLATKWNVVMLAVAMLSGAAAGPARAQLHNTEIKYEPNSTGDNLYEYIEVRNTGASAVDLDGAYLGGLGTPLSSGQTPNILSPTNPDFPGIGGAMNTVIGAGKVGVIYDAYQAAGSPANFDDSKFRSLWGLSAGVPLIGADFWPTLSNSNNGLHAFGNADEIGIWANRTQYDADTNTGSGMQDSFTHALASVSYDTANSAATGNWPAAVSAHSIQWNGTGNPADPHGGANWYVSKSGAPPTGNNAATSVIVTGTGGTGDIANPGKQGPGTPGAAFAGKALFTEVMANPFAAEPTWEWAEVYNNTGATLNFATTPGVFDDGTGNNISAANINSGTIPNGTTAVLFDAAGASTANTVDALHAAWGNTVNFIPVNVNWPALSNDGKTIALWSSLASYQMETVTGSGSSATRTLTNAIASLPYSNNANGWPDDPEGSSLYLTNLGVADPRDGANWAVAADGDGLSFDSLASLTLDSGNEQGSPGTFSAVSAGLPGDYNNDGVVDAADYTVWRDHFGQTQAADGYTLPNEASGVSTGTVAQDDYDYWKQHFGSSGSGSGSLGSGAVPEPGSIALLALGFVGLVAGHRRFCR